MIAPWMLVAALTGSVGGADGRQPFELSWSSVDGGGGRSTGVDGQGNPFYLAGSIGQADAGRMFGSTADGAPPTTFVLEGGFLVDFFVPCGGDTNGDRVIDFFDLNNCLSDFGTAGAALLGDLNRDGVSDFLDLNLCLSFFGQNCDD